MKAGFEESLRERDELHERNLRSMEEQKDKGNFYSAGTIRFIHACCLSASDGHRVLTLN
jgi:hypothetical protein